MLLFATISGLAQISPVPPKSASLEVFVQVQYEGYILPDREAVYGPANFILIPFVQTTLPLHAGDTVTIDIYADGRKISSQKAVWHPEVRPGPHDLWLHISPAQFYYKFADWTNVSEGGHVILAHACDFHGLSAFSTPMRITVLPPLPPQTVSGTHEATGTPRPPLKPEQARTNDRAPRLPYQIVGAVTAHAPGQWSRDAAVAELKKQAAQLGANWIILDEFKPIDPLSGTDHVFIKPENRLSGTAVYVPSLAAH